MKYPEWTNPQRWKADYWLPGARGGEEFGVTANRHGVSFWGDDNVVELDSGGGRTTL